MNPKVFISHASEDKERFVLSFAEKLRAQGVDAWLDKWEMQVGDSLVDKIFEEGIKEAQAVIIVLSQNSIVKPWVKEELNVSFVNRLSKGTKIIPIILDECKIPESLISTLWVNIKDTNNYDEDFKSILSSIFGLTNKPKLGDVPTFIKENIIISDLTELDSLILKTSCEYALKHNSLTAQQTPLSLLEYNKSLNISISEIDGAIEILEEQGYLTVHRMMEGVYFYYPTSFGFHSYANSCLDNFVEKEENIIGLIVNKKIITNFELQEESGESLLLIDCLLEIFDNEGLIKVANFISGLTQVINVSTKLRRKLK